MPDQDDLAGKIGPLTYSELAAMLLTLRKTMNLRQHQLADLSPVTTRTIKRIEKGEKLVRPYHLEGVCQALGFELRVELQYTLVPIKHDSSTPNIESEKETSV